MGTRKQACERVPNKKIARTYTRTHVRGSKYGKKTN